MKYYRDITIPLQFILVKRWVDHNIFCRFVAKLIGSPIIINKPIPNLLELCTNGNLFKENGKS